MRIIILLLVMCFAGIAYGQPESGTENKKADKQFSKAMQAINARKLDEAATILQKLIQKEPQYFKAFVTLADIYYADKLFEKAEILYEEVNKRAPKFTYKTHLQCGKIRFYRAQYAESLPYFDAAEKFKNLPFNAHDELKLLRSQALFALTAIENPVSYVQQNLGDSVNTVHDEYLPAFTADGQTLIFTRKINNQEDFFQSNLYKNGSFNKATPVGDPLNTNGNEGAHCISPDGLTLYFTACNRPDSYGGCDLYVTKKQGNTWQKPTNLGEMVNSAGWDSQPSISADGKTLYFASNRRGGLGGSDIWFTKLLPNGEWDVPKNLGAPINTRKDEYAPFIHADNQTLYFTSDGHPGLGNQDIYFSRRIGKDFGQPQNLGYPINNVGNQNSLFIGISGKTAYFATTANDTRGGKDLYSFELPEAARPTPVVYLKGTTLDADANQTISAQVEIFDINNNEKLFEIQTQLPQSQFLVCLPAKRTYVVQATAPHYLFYSDLLEITDTSGSMPKYTIKLQPIVEGSEIVLQNIFFDTNEANLKSESFAELNLLLKFMEHNKDLVIEIQGHTDNVGDKRYNKVLSEKRAKAVYDFLITNKITPERLNYRGFGDTMPKTTNDTEESRAKNRRTQFVIKKINK